MKRFLRVGLLVLIKMQKKYINRRNIYHSIQNFIVVIQVLWLELE